MSDQLSQSAQQVRKDGGSFKWICLAVAVLFGGALLYMVKTSLFDIRSDVRRIVDNTKKSTETLGDVSDDVRELRALLGLSTGGARDKSLVTYAREVLDLVEAQGAGGQVNADIGTGAAAAAKRLGGEDGKPIPVDEWVRGARKEALYLVMTSTSRKEILEALCRSKYKSRFVIKVGDKAAEPLIDWIRARHPASATLDK